MDISELLNKFRTLKNETTKQESIKKNNSPYWAGNFKSSDLPLLQAVYKNENKINKDFTLYSYVFTGTNNINIDYRQALNSSDKDYNDFMRKQWERIDDEFIIYIMKLMDLETLRPLHEKTTIGYHGLQSTILYSTDYIKKRYEDSQIDKILHDDLRIATRHALLIHDIGKILHQSIPGSHNTLGIVVLQKYPDLLPTWMNKRQELLVKRIIRYHDVAGRLARGISHGEYNPCEDCSMVKLCTTYKSAIDKITAKHFISSLNISDLPYEKKLDINMNIFKADVSSVHLLSRGVKSIPYIRELLLNS